MTFCDDFLHYQAQQQEQQQQEEQQEVQQEQQQQEEQQEVQQQQQRVRPYPPPLLQRFAPPELPRGFGQQPVCPSISAR